MASFRLHCLPPPPPPVLLVSVLLCLCAAAAAASSSSYSSSLSQKLIDEYRNHTGISDFRLINRRVLGECLDPNPYLAIHVDAASPLPDEANVTVTISGVLDPDKSDWVAMITPTDADVNGCALSSAYYIQTGDLSNLPLLCQYPVKAQYLSSDPGYLGCKKQECQKRLGKECLVRTCNASITFHVINIRTDIEFVFFAGGFDLPCVLRRSQILSFSNPDMPLYGHLSSVDSSGTSMRLTWVSGDQTPQFVELGDGTKLTSKVSTFTQDDMCSTTILPSPAKDFGWHSPGYIHSVVITGLRSSQTYSYRYGSDSVGWSSKTNFKTPAAAGSSEVRFLAFGDMGKAPFDSSIEHYIQPGSLSTVAAMTKDIESGMFDSIFHIGDISYATGFLVEWDFFLSLIEPLASHLSYMTAIGNHERDYAESGSVYETPDSGGECGIAYETYFPMPTAAKDKPWYSIEQGAVHFTVISTEHNWTINSEQYNWIQMDLSSVNRTRTPWVIFIGHRPMYSSYSGILPAVDSKFPTNVEPLLLNNKVDLVFFGHVHNYERTCAIYQSKCRGMPRNDSGVDTYDNNNYVAPVHAVIGAGGFTLDKFPSKVANWSLSRIKDYGYVKVHATREDLDVQFVNSNTMKVQDHFHIIKKATQTSSGSSANLQTSTGSAYFSSWTYIFLNLQMSLPMHMASSNVLFVLVIMYCICTH